MHHYGWSGKINDFLEMKEVNFIDALCKNIYENESRRDEEELKKIKSQIRAWKDCFRVLQSVMREYADKDYFLIFEYSILRGGGRRPDVILILPGEVLVLEFKGYSSISDSELTQTSLYVRDIQHYHSIVQKYNLRVTGVVVETESNNEVFKISKNSQVCIASKKSLNKIISNRLNKQTNSILVSNIEFLNGEYMPLPSIIEAARAIMKNEDLFQIKTTKSSNFDEVLYEVRKIITEAKMSLTHHLVLISGVPGAGKTYIGLKLAHETQSAVYLSGNGPLVDVLQDSLKNKTFVQALYGYKNDFIKYGRIPHEQVIIFDEAQRAWDSVKMGGVLSEPDVIVNIAKNNKPWSVVIGLIGEGQEIHLGEEGGLKLWNKAIDGQNIKVDSKHSLDVFTNASECRQNINLHLNCSLRTHDAVQYFNFVNELLDGNIDKATSLFNYLKSTRYVLKITDNLDKAKKYLSNIYESDNKTYGIVYASGNDRSKHVQAVPFPERNVNPKPIVAYFNYPQSEYYCKKLHYAATEFQTQGLELDIALVHWDEDLVWDNSKWKCNFLKKGAIDPYNMKLNAYRVLLTRGRDGTLIYVPPQLKDSVYKLFISIGLEELR